MNSGNLDAEVYEGCLLKCMTSDSPYADINLPNEETTVLSSSPEFNLATEKYTNENLEITADYCKGTVQLTQYGTVACEVAGRVLEYGETINMRNHESFKLSHDQDIVYSVCFLRRRVALLPSDDERSLFLAVKPADDPRGNTVIGEISEDGADDDSRK